MQPRIYHGEISPSSIAQSLVARFNQGNYQVQQMGSGDHLSVQIATSRQRASGGQTAVAVDIQKVPDGIAVQVGQQAWFGVAASLGASALSALLNPWNLLGRLDDIAQDFESIKLSEEIWKVIDITARSMGTGRELSARLKRSECEFCGTANPAGEPSCVACGAPLGNVQPDTCKNCGFIVQKNERFCPNCGSPL